MPRNPRSAPRRPLITVLPAAAAATATTPFVAVPATGVPVSPEVLDLLTATLREHPGTDVVYGDVTRPGDGAVVHAPDWSPERLRGQDYLGGLVVLRTALVREAAGLGDLPAGADVARYDLALRVTERAHEVRHLDVVLAESFRPPATDDAAVRRAVAAHLARVGVHADVAPGPVPGTARLTRTGPVPGRVSVVIPTRGDAGEVFGARRVFVVDAVRSLLSHAGDVDVEVVVVHDPPTPQESLDTLRDLCGDRLVLVPYTEPFNYSRKCNLGAAAATGSVLVMLNDDTQAISPDFLYQLVAPLAEPGVGMTGAHLLYEDGTVQHAGVNVVREGPYHPLRGLPDDAGHTGALAVNREVSALTGAALAVTRTVWDQVGGLDEGFPVNFNDTDLSLKVAATGRRLVWLAAVRAYHFESKSRPATAQAWEEARFRARWAITRTRDPYLDVPLPAGSRLRSAARAAKLAGTRLVARLTTGAGPGATGGAAVAPGTAGPSEVPTPGTRAARDRVAAVVVAFRSAPLLAACLDALRSAGVDDVVVVDNNDDDGDAAAIAALTTAHPGLVRSRATGRNLGFAAACNLGAADALDHGADVLWFVNPDTVAAAGSADVLVRAMRDHGLSLASPLLTTGSEDAETIWFGGGTFDARTGRARHDLHGDALPSRADDPRECTFLTGAALAVTRAAWQTLGGFDERYFLYWEDSDLSVRATRAGLRLGVVPAARVWHAEGASSAGRSPGRSALGYYYYTRNRLLLARRLGRLAAWSVGPGIVLTLKPVGAALLTERAGRWHKTGAALRGTVHGLRGVRGPDPGRGER